MTRVTDAVLSGPYPESDGRRRTRIVASIGPASQDPATVEGMIRAGMDVARLSLAHDGPDVVRERMAVVRGAAATTGHPVAVLVDLPGPKLRLAPVGPTPVELAAQSTWRLRPGAALDPDEHVLGADVPVGLLEAIRPGTRLAIGDGAVVLEALAHDGSELVATVRHGGRIRGRPGLHVPSCLVDLPVPTDEDLAALARLMADPDPPDMVAVSFVRSAADLARLGLPLHPTGPLVVAKIETEAAVANLDAIVVAAGAVMVARGDLGLEFPLEEVPLLQKRIIRTAIASGRPVVTATQVLESMVSSPIPTRAEAADAVNAVLDGTSALMLSAETAIGCDPVGAVAAMARLIVRADSERRAPSVLDVPAIGQSPEADDVTHAVSLAAVTTADHLDAAAIVCLTATGFVARATARLRPPQPIVAVTPDPVTARQLALSWGVRVHLSEDRTPDSAVTTLTRAGLLRPGDRAVVVSGPIGIRAADSLIVRIVP